MIFTMKSDDDFLWFDLVKETINAVRNKEELQGV